MPIFSQTGDGKELISAIFQACADRFPLVEGSFSVTSQGYLRSHRQIVDTIELEALLSWMTPERIRLIDNQLKDRLRKHFLVSIHRRGTPLRRPDQWKLSQLPIFKELIASETESDTLFR